MPGAMTRLNGTTTQNCLVMRSGRWALSRPTGSSCWRWAR